VVDWLFIVDESDATASPTVKKRLSARMKVLDSSAFFSFSMTSARGLTNTSCHNTNELVTVEIRDISIVNKSKYISELNILTSTPFFSSVAFNSLKSEIPLVSMALTANNFK
jgi:hypothetical protein